MKKDIKLLQIEIQNDKKMFEDYGERVHFDNNIVSAIENLINKYKEQEKIIGLMAVDLMVCVNDFIRFGMFTGNFKKDKELVIEYYEKKARENNELV